MLSGLQDRGTAEVSGLSILIAASGSREWPDGTICEAYRFQHSVYRDVAYERIPTGRRVRLHRQIAARMEQAYRGHEGEIAAELACHFSEGRDRRRAVHFLQLAAEQGLALSAHREPT